MPLYKKRKSGTETENLQGYIPKEQAATFKRVCQEMRISVSEGIERAVRRFLEENERGAQ